MPPGSRPTVCGTPLEQPVLRAVVHPALYDEDPLFHGPGLCLKSLACGVTGGDWATFSVHDLPKAWFGDVPHTHRAIDDARGYANLLVEVLRQARSRG